MDFDLKPIFYPDTIAVVGVSATNIFNPGTTIFRKNLLIKGYRSNKVFGVNPKGGMIEGIPLERSLITIPSKIDLAVISVRSKYAVDALKDAVSIGVKGVVVISGGFSEMGSEGKKYQDELAKVAIDNGIPLIGPNCVGVFNPGYVNTFFIPQERFVLPKTNGNVAVISQSGGVMADQWFCKFYERGIGISKAVSLGNKAVIDEVDMLEYFERDPDTDVIGFYLEGFSHNKGREFLLKSRLTNKTIIMMKGGKTPRGIKAAASHTASIATNERLMEGAFKQFSIISCNTEQELIAYTKTFSLLSGRKKPFFSRAIDGRLAILTVSGGHGVLASDLTRNYNLNPINFSDEEKRVLKERLSPSVKEIASLDNPIDLTGSCTDDDIVNVLDELMKNERVEIILLNILPYPPGITMFLGSRIASIIRMYKKPVICYLPYLARYEMIIEALNDANIPVGNTIEEALLMVNAVYLKSRAISRANFNKMIDNESVLIEDYHEFSKVIEEINLQMKLKQQKKNKKKNRL
ncbi:MAG: CoA-binding protein [Promethearchaeota archaeon]